MRQRLRHGLRSRRPLRYPWEWTQPLTRVSCPWCGTQSLPVKPSRRRDISCRRCGALFNSYTGRVRAPGKPLGPPGEGTSGVREPRGPVPLAGSGAAALPLPEGTGAGDEGVA